MSDVSERMVEYAYRAFEQYKDLPSSDQQIEFNGFAIGYFLGALAASGRLPKS